MTDTTPTPARRPLDGVRVLEFGHVAAGPFGSMLLADLGADVVKVEGPGGDQMRDWPPLAEAAGERFSHNFASVNRNKRSVVADLKDPDDVARVQCSWSRRPTPWWRTIDPASWTGSASATSRWPPNTGAWSTRRSRGSAGPARTPAWAPTTSSSRR